MAIIAFAHRMQDMYRSPVIATSAGDALPSRRVLTVAAISDVTTPIALSGHRCFPK
jgi:hypothetical protein